MTAKRFNPFTRVISVLLIVIIALTAMPVSPAAAASSVKLGTLFDNMPVGTNYDWLDLFDLPTDNDYYSYIDLPGGAYSDRLYVHGFKLDIPAGATIDGITVSIPRRASNTNSIRDVAVNLVRGGEVVGTPKSVTGTWPNTEVVQAYGAANDTWGVTNWTAEQINADDFGVTLEVRNSALSTRRPYVDYIRVTVTYSFATTLTISPLTVLHGESATLSATMSPVVAGKTIAFTLNGAAACSGTTNAYGVASCTPAAAFTQNANTYTGYIGASFAGEPDYKASSAVGDLIVAPRPLTVAAAAEIKTYDGTTTSTRVPSITSGSLIAGDTAEWSQAFDNKNAGTSKAIIATGVVTDGNGGSNYTINFINATGAINKRPITVSAVPDTKVYDGTTASSGVPQLTSGSLVNGESAVWTQAFTSENVGAIRSLTPTGAVSDGNNGENYDVSFITALGEITARPITVTAAVDTKVYDGTTASDGVPQITAGTLAEGDTANWTQAFDDENAGAAKVLTPAGVVSDGNSSANYTVTFVDAAGVITRRPITVSAVTGTKVYDGTTVSTVEPVVTGALAEGDTADWSQAYNSKHAGADKTLTASGTVSDGNNGENYTVTFETATGEISRRPITVTATAATKGYDGSAASSGVPTITDGTLVDGDTAVWTQTYNDEHAGTNKVLTPDGEITDGNNGGNYAVTFETELGVITPKAITVTAETDSKVYDGTATSKGLPAITEGALVDGDTATWSQAFEDKHVGTLKTITPTGVIVDGNSGGNYDVEYISVTTGEITPLAITVSAVEDTKVYDGTPDSDGVPAITGGALVGGDAAAFTQSFADEHAGEDKVITPAGVVNDGNHGGNYAVEFETVLGSITQRPIEVTAAADSKVYDGTTASDGEPTITAGELVTGDTAAWSQAYDSKHIGATKVLTPSGVVTDGNNGANYSVTFHTVSGEITARAITVSAVVDTKVYDGTTASAETPEVTSGSLAGSDTLDYDQTFVSRNVGEEIVLTAAGVVLDGNNGANYLVTLETALGSITPRPISVTAAADSKVFDGSTSSDGVPSITEGELADGDTATFSQAFETKHAGTNKVLVPAAAINDGNQGANYVVALLSVSTGEITPMPITVKAVTDIKIYDGTTSSDGVPTITGGALISGDTATWSQSFKDANVSAQKEILPEGVITDGNNGGNYAVTFVNALGIITPRELIITAVTDSKPYDGLSASNELPQITEGELAAGDTATWMQSFEDEHAGTGKTIIPGGEIEDGNNGGNYAVTFEPVETGVITPLAITVSAQAESRVYDGTTNSALEPQITAGTLVAGDTAGFTQAFATRNAGEDIAINVLGQVNDGNGGDNYEVTLVPAQGDITPRALTVTAVTETKVYDGTPDSALEPEITAGELAAGDSEAFFQAFDNKNAGSGKTITPDGEVDDNNNGDNYVVTFVPVSTGEITKLAITVTADEITKQFGEEDPELTIDVEPALASGDSFTGALVREDGEAVGTYAILIGTLSAGDNYEMTFVGADFIIVKADQVITVITGAPTYAVEGTTFEVEAVSSSGLPVTYSSSGACTNDGAVFTMTSNTGTCQVIFDQAGDDSHNPAETVLQTVRAGLNAVIYIYTPIIWK